MAEQPNPQRGSEGLKAHAITVKPPPAPAAADPKTPPAGAGANQQWATLSPAEVEQLRGLGLQVNDPLPEGLPEAIQAYREAGDGSMPPPGEMRALVYSLAQKEREAAEAASREEAVNPVARAAHEQAKAMAAAVAAGSAATPGPPRVTDGKNVLGLPGVDDPAPSPDQRPAQGPPAEAGAAAPRRYCRQCGFDQTVEAVEPTAADKDAFVQHLLGMRPFEKEYQLLGGALLVRFRTIRRKELDALYAVNFQKEKEDPGLSEAALVNLLNRNRFLLQLNYVRLAGGAEVQFPEGLDRASHPEATTTWETVAAGLLGGEDLQKFAAAAADRGLYASLLFEKVVEPEVVRQALRQETTWRIAENACYQFNRVVARMEAMADSTDFWQPTGSPSA